MKTTLSVVVVLAAVVQQASATLFWGTNKYFPSPSNCDNRCSDNQKSGFDWTGLGLGPFSSFGDFGFSGFTCGERKRPQSNFQSKCIEGKLLRGLTNGTPEISYRKSNGFSITSFQITVDEDTDIGFVYTMPDGSTCKHTTPCSKGGSEVPNTQCGGAVSVKFSLPKYSELDDCGFAIHKITFDCGPPEIPSKPVVTPTDEISSYSQTPSETYPPGTTPGTPSETFPPSATPGNPSELYPSGTPPASQSETYPPGVTPGNPSESYPPGSTPVTPSDTTPPGTSPSEVSPSGSTPSEATPPGTAPPVVTPPGTTPTPIEVVSYSTSTFFTTSMIVVTSCAPEVTSCPTDSTEVVTTTFHISTTFPITNTQTSPDPIITGSYPTSPTPAYPTPTSPADSTSPPIGESTATPPSSSGSAVTQIPPSGSTITEIIYTIVTTCPVTETITSGTAEITLTSNTVSTITVTTTGTVCPGCPIPTPPGQPDTSYPAGSPPPPPITYPAPSGSATPSPPSSASPVTDPPSPSTPALPPAIPIEAPCPKVVPQCLNTWLNLVPKCSSNSDVSCFCPSSEFTSAVIACIQSWGASDDEIQSALSYFTGICAADVPKNPGIITAIPSTITLTPPAPTPPAAQTGGPTIVTPPPQPPCTTITVSQVITVSGSEPTTRTTIVTVPQVQFVTETVSGATTGVNVGLVPGTTALPAEVPTYGSPSYPTANQPSTLATVPVSPTRSEILNPYTGTGDAFSLSIPSTLWILSAITIAMGVLQ
ncbi:hypothetical protein ACJ73_04980 [Blastomyces percursus]|uniref:CFEM domain-containing protein n=1 Tax=Blastomyces percursus TaxID=1658174 RepID=A0A1J9Q5B2_9EURO|nr:hypothetical protein ACJ73_04980 [Blastomyces percursus]